MAIQLNYDETDANSFNVNVDNIKLIYANYELEKITWD